MSDSDKKSDFFGRVYKARGATETVDLYDEWAETYDDTVTEAGYATPARMARLLELNVTDKNAPLLDFGCGTGLLGVALKNAGFSAVDGMDVSEGMRAKAGALGVYRQLSGSIPNRPLPVAPGEYGAVAACGVVGAGAAPLSVLQDLLDILAPGQILAFSFNDHTLENRDALAYVERLTSERVARQIAYEYGAHLPNLDIKSAIYLFEKL